MRNLLLYFFLLSLSSPIFSQEKSDSLHKSMSDSLMTQEVGEVIVIGNPSAKHFQEKNKSLGSLDSYLKESNSINMVRRGAYAWEALLNGMPTERSVITIDGMRIFQACTDKMDPITSYVENTNLSSAKIEDGQSGAEYGGTIAGSIDLIRKKTGFSSKSEFGGALFGGYESNNQQQIYGSSLNYSTSKLFADVDFTFRDAANYRAGHSPAQKDEVEFSQFTKYNFSAIAGLKISEREEIEASVIFDRASDVGYPGLTMDVSLAEAVIASVQYRLSNLSEQIYLWESKIYLNSITHIMDDSPRPIVPIRMHMPGWSKTEGFYSKIMGSNGKHYYKATLSAYRNNSLAEMTMFPNDPKEKDMFMLTWPDINTQYAGINLEDNIGLTEHLALLLRGGMGIHNNQIESEVGLNSLQLFYPHLEAEKTRLLKNASTQLSYHRKKFLYQLGIGYGERAPSVSEGYGFYLLNVNDNYDYIGNPYLKKEKSLNLDIATSYQSAKFSAKLKGNYFYIMDYIIAKPSLDIPAMNMNANGIKIHEQLNDASIFNASVEMGYMPFANWKFSSAASYRYGQGAENTILPLIQPFSYNLKARYAKKDFFAEAGLQGSSKNRNSIEFGESQKPAYAIVDVAFSKNFTLKNNNLSIKLGVENLFDHYYSTFADWFGIPSMGRNIYTNLIFKF